MLRSESGTKFKDAFYCGFQFKMILIKFADTHFVGVATTFSPQSISFWFCISENHSFLSDFIVEVRKFDLAEAGRNVARPADKTSNLPSLISRHFKVSQMIRPRIHLIKLIGLISYRNFNICLNKQQIHVLRYILIYSNGKINAISMVNKEI